MNDTLFEAIRQQVPPPVSALTTLHGSVPGRLRLAVPGLYRTPRLAARLERRLAGRPGIRRASANALTGHLLVLFEPTLLAEDVVALLQRLLAEADAPEPAASALAPAGTAPAWHAKTAAQAVAELGSSAAGLTAAAAAAALARYGPNRLPCAQPRSPWELVREQLHSLPVMLLLGAATLAAATGGVADAVVILGVVALNAGIGYVTERQTERTLQTLGQTTPALARVLRDGKLCELAVERLVPGDILLLLPGMRVAADARLLKGRNLSVDEAALTGESVPVGKLPAPLAPDTPLADRINMVHMGTLVTGGNGVAVVVATGAASEIGTIQALVDRTAAPPTPMQRQLDRLGRQMVWLSSGACVAVFALGLLRGYGLLPMLSTAVALAVAAVPEGLPTVATTTLALGVRRMRRHRVLIRQLDAVETLGALQVVCLDKTGTLTQNRMRVVALHAGELPIAVRDDGLWGDGAPLDPYAQDELLRLLQVAVLCNETRLSGTPGAWVLEGSATESALLQLALGAGLDAAALRARYPLTALDYRAEGRNYMRSLHADPAGGTLAAVKGSPAEVLALCRWRQADGARLALDGDAREAIQAANERMAGDGLRVLGFAYRGSDDDGLVWLGLAGLTDPLRPGVTELVGRFHRAGIRTVMITGDQSATAYAIGKELALAGARPLEIMDSVELGRLPPELLARLVDQVDVFARVSPANKLTIVQGLQRDGRVVAMTGDGINDGPALRAADIGIALGRGGTDTARAVADVVIEDDELGTLMAAVGEGRTIYRNIRKAVHFLMATNASELLLMLAALGAGLGQPLSAMQLLWINLLSDVLPALALAVEPAEADVLVQPPRAVDAAIIGNADLSRYGREAALLTAGALAGYGYGLARYGAGARAGTMAFGTLVIGQLLHALGCRSDTRGVLAPGALPPNRYLDGALAASFGLQGLALLLPGLRRLLGTAALGPLDLAVALAGGVLPLLINEAVKPAAAATGEEA